MEPSVATMQPGERQSGRSARSFPVPEFLFAHAEGAIAILGENVGDQLFPVGAG
jgi:hypothetical protein